MKFEDNIVITVEGIDGSGKGTQAKKIKEYLESQGKNVVFQDFPTYKTPAGKLLGKYLNGELKNTYNKPTFLASLYALDRVEFMESAEIKKGDVLLFDRFTYSALSYQSSFANEESEKMFNFIWDNEFDFMGLPESDLVVWLDVSPEVAQQNVLTKNKRGYTDKKMDLHEGNLSILEGARNGYSEMQKKIPNIMKRIKCDDGEQMQPIEDIFEQIKSHIDSIKKKLVSNSSIKPELDKPSI